MIKGSIGMSVQNNKQRGAVSLFVVVFSALLITVVTVSFVRIMVQDQQQASTTDLSQSAYDSAQAGVEDAKRALLQYQSMCNSGSVDCATVKAEMNKQLCNTALSKLADVSDLLAKDNNEVKIQTGDTNKLDQAYTCVKIILDTPNYIGSLSADESKIIPLISDKFFDTVQIEWFSSDDISSSNNFNISLQGVGSTPLLAKNTWAVGGNRPPIMRTQLMQFGSSFNLDNFDDINSADGSDANTVFLYPSGSTGIANQSVTAIGSPGPDTRAFINRDIRQAASGTPLPIKCSGNLGGGGFACTAKLQLPTPIGGGDRTAFLRLSAIYNKTNYQVTLLDSTKSCDQATGTGLGCVKFSAVQPEIDSTGRTNDLFRRVSTRVELTDINFPYPEAEVDVSGSFCKNFMVTNNPADYIPNVSGVNCTP